MYLIADRYSNLSEFRIYTADFFSMSFLFLLFPFGQDTFRIFIDNIAAVYDQGLLLSVLAEILITGDDIFFFFPYYGNRFSQDIAV